jgi:hypothetical protein
MGATSAWSQAAPGPACAWCSRTRPQCRRLPDAAAPHPYP